VGKRGGFDEEAAFPQGGALDGRRGFAARRPGLITLMMAGTLVVPALCTVLTIREPLPVTDHGPDSSPYGYSVSLLLWIVPIVVILSALGWRAVLRDRGTIQWRAAMATAVLLCIVSTGLELLFGARFFTFANEKATVGVSVPVWRGHVPLEELLFYLLGYLAILLFYIWCDEVWLQKYNLDDYADVLRKGLERSPDLARQQMQGLVRRISVRLIAVVVVTATLVFVIALSGSQWPQYLSFVLLAGVLPVVVFWRIAAPYVNWQALSFTLFIVLLVSLLWETTLGVPYQWWGYRHEYMAALQVRPWSGLPAEAVLVWALAPWTTIVVYEVFKVWLAAAAIQAGLKGRGQPGGGIEPERSH
jgi:hypothetical protein